MADYKKPEDITFTNVESSNVKSVGYDAETKGLYVTFKSNEVYIYEDVPADIAEGLSKAESVGKYLNTNIKPAYKVQKVTKAA